MAVASVKIIKRKIRSVNNIKKITRAMQMVSASKLKKVQGRLLAIHGPAPKQAVAECLDTLEAMEQMGFWPGPRDAVYENEARRLRQRWAKLKSGYRHAPQGK